MEFNKIISNENKICDLFIAKSCVMLSAFTILVWIFNLLNIFVVEPKAMAFCAITSAALLTIPSVVYLLQKRGLLSCINYKYFAMVFIFLSIGQLYSYLTIHTIFLFMFPSIVFNIYGDKKLIKWTMAGTIITMIISHIASEYLSVIPEEPFTEMYQIIIYGLLPKIMIYIAFMYAFSFETKHNDSLLNKIYSYARDMHQTQEELVRAFAEMCENESGQTGSHLKRVSAYVNIIAQKLGINGIERECLVTASMMHDVGKLNIPTQILDKPGKLTPEEYEIIKKHTDYGHNLLKNSPGRTMEIASDIALNHHERWDGNGYNKIKGENVSLYSRIMTIADVFDALVSKRSYKEKWKPEDAYNEIVSQSGKQFDPSLVNVFIECFPQFLEVLSQYSDE